MMNKDTKTSLIERFKEHPQDTGSTSVQIALLSERIKYLTEHIQEHKKDHHSRRGLLLLLGRRRSLLSYLKKKDSKNYLNVKKELGIK